MKSSAYPEFIGFKLTYEQRLDLEELAEKEGHTLSGYIRSLISREAQRSVCGCAKEGATMTGRPDLITMIEGGHDRVG